jgi:hypothetical protein
MRKALAIGMFIIALFCFWIFYDIVAVRLALLLGASRPMFHSDLTVFQDSTLPRWTCNSSVSDEAGNVLFADYQLNMLVLIQGLSEETRGALSWFEYHLHRHSDSQKATLLAGTSHEVTVWANPNRLVVIVCNDVEFTLRLDRGSARAIMSNIQSTSGLRLPGDALLAEVVRRYPLVESLLVKGLPKEIRE